MASSGSALRRRRRDEVDEDAGRTPLRDLSQSHASRIGNNVKRLRVESNQPSDDDEDEEESDREHRDDTINNEDDDKAASNIDSENEASETEDAATQISATQPNDTQQTVSFSAATNNLSSRLVPGTGLEKDGYKPGAIVRIKLTDFVTYTSAEFFPGPKLNMVIGPNGTGKSTLVCAICLGLGWGPQHLGRAKDPGEFVKHGSSEATIEIELARSPNKRGGNPVVCRTIKREGNKSTFSLDGAPASRAQVLKLAQSFSIQIDNLCQFLPQDKVSEFAALTPVELLYSTQRAAAGPEMIRFHDDLKKLRAEQRKMQVDNKSDRDSLANLESRQEMQRADVERMRQRGQIKRKIEMLEFARPIVQYKDYHTAIKALKEQKARIGGELDELKATLEPALRTVNAKQDYTFKMAEAVKRQRRTVDGANSAASDLGKKIEQYEDLMKDLNNQIEAERKAGQNYRHEASRIIQTINRLKRQWNEEPVEFDVNFYNEKIRDKRRQMRDIESKAREIKARRPPLIEQQREKTMRVEQTVGQLRNLDSQTGRQEGKLQSLSADSHKAYRWLLENQHRFEKEVFGPPVVCCSVKNPEYADAVESLFQKTEFITFTTQTRNDFRTLQRLLSDMKLSDIAIRTCSIPLESFQAPLSEEELMLLGFDGWVKDFLSGPEPVLAMFCSESRLHQTPVTLRDISDEEFTRLESGSISSWIAGKQAYQVVRRREYGPSATSTRVRQVRPAKIWTSKPVESSVKQGLESNIQTWRQELSEVQENIDADKGLLSRLGDEHKESEREMVGIEQEKSLKQTALVSHKAIPEKITQQEGKQKDLERFFREIKTRVMGIRSQQDEMSIEKAEATIAYADSVDNIRRQYEKLIKTEIRRIEACSDFEILREQNGARRERVEAKDAEYKEISDKWRTGTEEGKKVFKEAQQVVRASKQDQPDLKAVLPTLADHTMEQLDADIDSEKARLELTHGGNSNVIKEFEEREKQIQAVRNKLSDFQDELGRFGEAINEIRGKWEPTLNSLVERINDAFSDSFARIGCAGQVSLDKVEDEDGPDFEQWSIQIHVKFRENESLSLLDSHRQSGGERAVSTIFYLMALQSLSASPFRVVDEINQGMDPRNERMVHERLVDIACATSENGADATGRGGGQYFLITPKLLNGLAYKPGMRVLCIVSGEHMPKNYNVVDFNRVVKRMRAITANDQSHCNYNGDGKGKDRAMGVRGHNGNVDIYA